MKIHRLQGYIQQIYLVEYPDKLLLLDGCCRCDVRMVRHFIENDLSRKISDLKLVLVTHMHPDHGGGAHIFRRISGCSIASADQRKQWYGGIRGFFQYFIDIFLGHLMARRMGKPKTNLWYWPYLRPDIRLRHGEALPDFPEWCVYETPGHTDRDLSAYHAHSGTVYVADLILRLKSGFAQPLGITNTKQYIASLKFVHSLNAQKFLLAHGGEAVLNDADFERLVFTTPSKMEVWYIYWAKMLKKRR